MEQILEKLKKKEKITFEESKSAFEILMTGKANEKEIYDFLTLLSEKGEVSNEIPFDKIKMNHCNDNINQKWQYSKENNLIHIFIINEKQTSL